MTAAAEPLPSPGADHPTGRYLCLMELFLYDAPAVRAVPADTALLPAPPRAIALRLACGGLSGWGRCEAPDAQRHFDLLQWSTVFLKLRGMTVAEGLAHLRKDEKLWGKDRKELAEAALRELENSMRRPTAGRIRKAKDAERDELIARSRSYCCYNLT